MADVSDILNDAPQPRLISGQQSVKEPGGVLASFTSVVPQPQARSWPSPAKVKRTPGRDASAKTGEEEPVVYAIDDDQSTIDSMRSVLHSVRIRLQTFATPEEFLSKPIADLPGCLVMDTRLPGLSGLDFQRQLKAADIHTPIVFMTRHSEVSVVVRAMKAGAVDFLMKPFREQEMLDAVMAAIEQDRNRRSSLAALSELKRRFASLTDRERQIMNDVVSGWMNKQIAARINLSEVTVKVHRGNVMRKMYARSLAELVKMAGALETASQRSC